MLTQQQKLNYLYEREKEKEYDECIDREREAFRCEHKYEELHIEEQVRLSIEFLGKFDEVEKRCKIEVS